MAKWVPPHPPTKTFELLPLPTYLQPSLLDKYQFILCVVCCCFFLAEEFDWLFNCRCQIYNTGTIAGGKNDRREFVWRQIWNRPKITLKLLPKQNPLIFSSLYHLCVPKGSEREREKKKKGLLWDLTFPLVWIPAHPLLIGLRGLRPGWKNTRPGGRIEWTSHRH